MTPPRGLADCWKVFGKELESGKTRKNGTPTDGHRYVFGEFEIDPVNRTLARSGVLIPVTGKVFDILIVFARNPGRLLEKDELIEEVWNGSFVEEGNLARNVSTLRKLLGDEGKDHKYIATVQGRGYRFIADVATVVGDQLGRSGHQTAPARDGNRKYWILAGVVLLVAVGVGFFFSLPRTSSNISHISTIEQIRLTTGGKASRAVLTPDGRRVVYTENLEVKVKDLDEGSTRQLVPPLPDIAYVHIAVSPDGANVYLASRVGKSVVTLYRVPIVGGEREQVLDNLYGGISFSPNGKQFAFLRRYPEANEYALLIADADGSNLRKLAASYRPDHFDGPPSWSPDGRTIVCPAIRNDDGFHFSIRGVNVADGSVHEIPSRRWAWLNSIVWLPSSRSLLIVGQAEGAVTSQLWQLDSVTGETRQMSADSFIYESLSGSRDGTKFVAIKKLLESHIWIVENGTPTQVTTGFDKYDGLSGLAWAPDGRLIYHSRASGRDALWRMKVDGSESEMLVPDGGAGFCVSPDNRFVIFQRSDGRGLGLSKLDLSTREITRLTTGTDMTPSFTPDGRSVVYANFGEKHAIYKVLADGGEPTLLFDEYRTVSSPQISPDGTKIAFAFGRAQSGSIQSGLGILNSVDNHLLATYNARLTFGTIYEHPTVQWSTDGTLLYYINLDGDVSNVWGMNTADSTTSMFTKFTTGRVFNFALSSDGSRLALARGTVESDVLVLRPTD